MHSDDVTADIVDPRRDRVAARGLRHGDLVETWPGGPRIFDRYDPYSGPHDFITGIAVFLDGWSMSEETNKHWTVLR